MQPSNTLLALLCAFSMAFVACNQNTPDDTKKGGDTQTNQPADPSTWSPVGKMYIQDFPAEVDQDTVHWFVFGIFPELGEDSTRGVQYHYRAKNGGKYGYTWYVYELDYPQIILRQYGEDPVSTSFIDTLTLKWQGYTYSCD